ncbi:MAG: hypothetical protein LBL52_01600 [Rickettsiales bacterium]|nr:hypothetical protein [Rickettsiales bacterium]
MAACIGSPDKSRWQLVAKYSLGDTAGNVSSGSLTPGIYRFDGYYSDDKYGYGIVIFDHEVKYAFKDFISNSESCCNRIVVNVNNEDALTHNAPGTQTADVGNYQVKAVPNITLSDMIRTGKTGAIYKLN